MKKTLPVFLLACFSMFFNIANAAVKEAPKEFSEESKQCIACHKKDNPGIVQQWGASKHYRAKVGCYECHAADKGDKDGYDHGKKGKEKHIYY